MGIFWIIVLLVVVPVILGLPWSLIFPSNHSWSLSYCAGFFCELALFELVCLPMVLTYGSFTAVKIIYSVLLLLSCMFCIWYIRKRKEIIGRWRSEIRGFRWNEVIYLVGFVFAICIQIIRGLTYDLTYMSADDAQYVVKATDALQTDTLARVDASTGEGGIINFRYALSCWLFFPAYLSSVSGLTVTIVVHTVQYIHLILLLYCTSWYIAGEIGLSFENQLIFVLIVAMFYWFGYHSHYSLTFRLLGPNYQGKAVLATSLSPFVLVVEKKLMCMEYKKRMGFFLLILSITAIMLTMWGTGTMIVLVLIPVVISMFRKERRWVHLKYCLWGCATPVFMIILYYSYMYVFI